eukprot:TRINITY_DN75125_c0_g1_i1.p1 TRINITY_DN75125_c0_g1~~TRINITY_DN75125_c0_g1_i1.p1  ORF type:complete len:323 (+),score=30.50 TRINITY_DN75125_c0_g1_i1:145-1113(+)
MTDEAASHPSEALEFQQERLNSHGYVILPSLLGGKDNFLEKAKQISGACSVFSYAGGAYSRNAVGNNGLVDVGYTDPEYDLTVHNEMAYVRDYPEYIAFFCEKAATEGGGETVLCDGRKVWQDLSARGKSLFAKDGSGCRLRYSQVYGNQMVHYESRNDYMAFWQDVFGCDKREEAEARARGLGYDVDWLMDDEMEVSFSRCAVRKIGGDSICFFDQILCCHKSHCTGFARDGRPHFHVTLINSKPCSEVTTNRNGGENSGKELEEIPQDIFREVEDLTKRHELVVSLKEGDAVVIDNLVVKHGRRRFAGKREMIVALLTSS